MISPFLGKYGLQFMFIIARNLLYKKKVFMSVMLEPSFLTSSFNTDGFLKKVVKWYTFACF